MIAAMQGKLLSVNVGRAEPRLIGGRQVLTGIAKRPSHGPVEVRLLGLVGDEQADLSAHGGLSKAVYAYPVEHYPFWQTIRAQARAADWGAPLGPGALGENLTISGLDETKAWIGDVLRFPDCELAVSEPRMPCFKLNSALGFAQAMPMMLKSGWCGFYLSVRAPGTLAADEPFDLIAGPREVGIAELFRARAGRRHG